jgi:dolichol-phosphate mannosyltransferase
MDADFSHDPRVIRHLLSKLSEAGAVVGSRYVTGGSVKNWNLPRRVLSRCANAYARAVLGLKPRDTTAGFIAIGRKALERVPLGDIASDGYAFLVELKYMLVNSGVTIAEYPIQFDERREGQSKMSAGKVWESALLPWRIRFGSTRAGRQERLKKARSAGQGGQ